VVVVCFGYDHHIAVPSPVCFGTNGYWVFMSRFLFWKGEAHKMKDQGMERTLYFKE
jgi:hypothetical protein